MARWGLIQCLTCSRAAEPPHPIYVQPQALYVRDKAVFRRVGWLLSCGHIKIPHSTRQALSGPYDPGSER